MEAERRRLIEEKNSVETEILRLKKLVKAESEREHKKQKQIATPLGDSLYLEDGRISFGALGLRILRQLEDIRRLLENPTEADIPKTALDVETAEV